MGINFKRLFILTNLLCFVVISMVSFFPANLYAADSQPFTLVYPDDQASINKLKAAASDGGIGDGDRDILNQTYILTKGGRLGTARLNYHHEMSDKHDMPIYSRDYYCTRDKNDQAKWTLSVNKPSASDMYARITLGVGLFNPNDWKNIVSDSNYPTRVGMLGNENVGTLHSPAVSDSNPDDPNYRGVAARQNDIPGAGGEHDLRTGFGSGNVPNTACIPSPVGAIGSKTSSFARLNEEDKKSWDKEVKDAGLGESAKTASRAPGGGAGGDDPDAQADCDMKASSPMSWIICPVIDLGANLTDFIFKDIVSPLLKDVPISTDRSSGSYKVWEQFRFLANILLIGTLLAIVYSQARGDK